MLRNEELIAGLKLQRDFLNRLANRLESKCVWTEMDSLMHDFCSRKLEKSFKRLQSGVLSELMRLSIIKKQGGEAG